MNKKMIFHLLGRILRIEAALYLVPIVTALCFRETPLPFIVTGIISLAAGELLVLLTRRHDSTFYAKEGFVAVALTWTLTSLIGALPFLLSGTVSSFADAFFETASGFTTTGATILTNVESVSRSVLMWRSFSHFVGGMGVLVLVMALVPGVGGRSIHLMRAEMPGPVVGKLVPKVRDTAKILYLIYLAMTALEMILLFAFGMSPFDSIAHSFGTAGTGGFGLYNDGLASFSPAIQWIIAVFMLLFGINFNIYYYILIKRFKSLKNGEMFLYLTISAAATVIICISVIPQFPSVSEALRASFFHVASIITTTGYSTCNFDLWPTLAKSVIFILLLIGGCSGSTAGGFKLSRVLMLFKLVRREFKKLVHPRSAATVKLDGEQIDERTLSGVGTYLALCLFMLGGTMLILAADPAHFTLTEVISGAATCFNNVGPGFDSFGPAGGFSECSVLSKCVLAFVMLAGRLEVYPILVALAPSTWRKS